MNVLYEARGVQLHAGVEDEEPGRAAFGFACTNTPAREDGNWRQLGGRPQAVPGLSAAPSPICRMCTALLRIAPSESRRVL